MKRLLCLLVGHSYLADDAGWEMCFRCGRQHRVPAAIAMDDEENCGDFDPDEGACILVPNHEGGCWHSMFGKPRQ